MEITIKIADAQEDRVKKAFATHLGHNPNGGTTQEEFMKEILVRYIRRVCTEYEVKEANMVAQTKFGREVSPHITAK